jgi:hypothetical protein
LCEQLDKPQVKKMDYNVYVRRCETSTPLIFWSPAKNNKCQEAFESPEDLHKVHPEFSANSRYFSNYDGRLFKNPESGDYQLLKEFPASASASPLPPEISTLPGLSQKDALFIGAYAPIP